MKLWDSENNFWIFNVEELNQLPNNLELKTIEGSKFIKGLDKLTENNLLGKTGYTNIGIKDPKKSSLKEYYFIFMLNS